MLRTKNHGRRTADGARRTDIWFTKSLPELSSGETKMADFIRIGKIKVFGKILSDITLYVNTQFESKRKQIEAKTLIQNMFETKIFA